MINSMFTEKGCYGYFRDAGWQVSPHAAFIYCLCAYMVEWTGLFLRVYTMVEEVDDTVIDYPIFRIKMVILYNLDGDGASFAFRYLSEESVCKEKQMKMGRCIAILQSVFTALHAFQIETTASRTWQK